MEAMYYVAFNADYLRYDVMSTRTYQPVHSFENIDLANMKAEQLNDNHHYGLKSLFKYHKEVSNALITGLKGDDANEYNAMRLEAIGRELEKRFAQLKFEV